MVRERISLMYPTRRQLDALYDEGSSPHIYNYFCLHGYQVFISRTRSIYSVFTRGWQPKIIKIIDTIRDSQGVFDYYVFRGKQIQEAMNTFRVTCQELLNDPDFFTYVEQNPLI